VAVLYIGAEYRSGKWERYQRRSGVTGPGQRVVSYDGINIRRTPFSNELHLTQLSLWARDLHPNSFSLFVSPCNISMSDMRQMRINPLWPNSSASFCCEWLRLKLLRLLLKPQRGALRKPSGCVNYIDGRCGKPCTDSCLDLAQFSANCKAALILLGLSARLKSLQRRRPVVGEGLISDAPSKLPSPPLHQRGNLFKRPRLDADGQSALRGTRKVLPDFGGQRCLPGWAGGESPG